MPDLGKTDPLHGAIEALRAALEGQTQVLANLERRIELIHEDVRRSAETMTRFKLASDNAKRLAQSHQELLSAIDKRLLAFEERLPAETD